jgi:hypothetical protein
MLPERTDDDVSADAMSETAPVVEAFEAPVSEPDALTSVSEVPAVEPLRPWPRRLRMSHFRGRVARRLRMSHPG